MISNYQYASSAIRKENIRDVYHKGGTTFFFFILFLSPLLGVVAYAVIVLSQHKAIEEQMRNPKQHHNIAALISLGFIFALYTTILDCIAAGNLKKISIYYSKDNQINPEFQRLLITSTIFELIACLLGIVWFSILCTFQCYEFKFKNPRIVFHSEDPKLQNSKDPKLHQYWWILLFLFIPPIWCLPSTFGFVIIAWSSFLRHSKSFTLFYIFAATLMFLVMRQVYKLCINIHCTLRLFEVD